MTHHHDVMTLTGKTVTLVEIIKHEKHWSEAELYCSANPSPTESPTGARAQRKVASQALLRHSRQEFLSRICKLKGLANVNRKGMDDFGVPDHVEVAEALLRGQRRRGENE